MEDWVHKPFPAAEIEESISKAKYKLRKLMKF